MPSPTDLTHPVPSAVFGDDVVRQISGYMNQYQSESLSLIAGAATDEWSIAGCVMEGFDAHGLALRARSDAGTLSIRVAWLRPIVDRAQVRTQQAELVERALDVLPEEAQERLSEGSAT